MAELKCDICNITLNESDIPLHLKGKRHRKKIEQFERLGRQIPESKLEDQQQDTVNISPKKEQPSAKTSEVVAKNVAQPPKKRPVKERGKRKLVRDEHADPKCTVPSAVVDNTKPFEEQVNDFISQVQQTENERKKINKVLFDVALTFSKVMPGVMPVLYGSQATGLAYRTSDIDVYLCNPYGRDEDVEFIKQHGKVIYKSRLFSDIVVITKARVPIIKAKHIETKIQLDISATSGQAVANSTLIYFLMSHDIRIRKLMMLIGYCVKKRALISVSRFKIYSINLLIIFYLQTLEKPILPPLKKLLYGIPGKTWPFCISYNVSLLHNENDTPLDELFIGFFEFYKTFPFTTHLISTYYGDKIPKKDLESSQMLESMFYYKIYMIYTNDKINRKNICIQDPFLLEFNTSVGVNPCTLDKFLRLCDNIICMKTKCKVEDWMNEILNGDVAKPLLEAKPITVLLKYPVSDNWTKKFESDFIKSLRLLHIDDTLKDVLNEETEERNSSKENEQTKICFMYSLETLVSPFTPGNRELIDLLKRKKIDLEVFSKKFKLDSKETNFNLSVNFTARSVKPGKVILTIENNGDISSYQNFALKFKNFIKLFLSFASEEAEKEHTSVETQVTEELKEIPDLQSCKLHIKNSLKEKSDLKKNIEIDAPNHIYSGELEPINLPLKVDAPKLLTPDQIEVPSQDSPADIEKIQSTLRLD